MKNKRLLAVLLVFVFVCGVVVSGALVFRVQVVEVHFLTKDTGNEYITDTFAVETAAKEAVVPIASGRNIIFALNRDEIIRAVEDTEKRVRVANGVVAQFPNKIVITLRERYAMYKLTEHGQTAILDARLRIVANEWTGTRNLVDIGDSFDITYEGLGLFAFEVGKDLTDYLQGEQNADFLQRANALVEMFSVLQSVGFDEAEIGHMVERISFDDVGTMIMNFRNENGTIAVEMEIRNFGVDCNDKIWAAYYVMQEKANVSAKIIVDISDDFDATGEYLIIPKGKLFVLWVPVR